MCPPLTNIVSILRFLGGTMHCDRHSTILPAYVFICFTDEEIHASGWELRLIERPDPEPALASRKLKIFPHEYISGHRYSLYVDANLQFLSDVSLLHALWLRGKTFCSLATPAAVRCFRRMRDHTLQAPARGLRRLLISTNSFETKAYPNTQASLRPSFLWRDHSNPDVQRLMKAWWAHLLQFGHRDQPRARIPDVADGHHARGDAPCSRNYSRKRLLSSGSLTRLLPVRVNSTPMKADLFRQRRPPLR